MSPFVYLPYLVKQEQEEMLKFAEHSRLVAKAMRAEKSQARNKSKFLGLIGKELASIGYSLELRFSAQPEPRSTLNQQGNAGGCA